MVASHRQVPSGPFNAPSSPRCTNKQSVNDHEVAVLEMHNWVLDHLHVEGDGVAPDMESAPTLAWIKRAQLKTCIVCGCGRIAGMVVGMVVWMVCWVDVSMVVGILLVIVIKMGMVVGMAVGAVSPSFVIRVLWPVTPPVTSPEVVRVGVTALVITVL